MFFAGRACSLALLAFALFLQVALALPQLSERKVPTAFVNVRIEGASVTWFEADLIDSPANVTTPSGGTHPCNGLNNGANPTEGPTATRGLAIAAEEGHFTFDGTFDTEFDDFFITRIASDSETDTEFWGLLLNYQFTPVGGCQQEVKEGDQILWAYNAFNLNAFLKLTPSKPYDDVAVEKKDFEVLVIDGSSGDKIEGANVTVVAGPHGTVGTTVGTSVANGTAELKFEKVGLYEIKAEKPGALRSNGIEVLVI